MAHLHYPSILKKQTRLFNYQNLDWLATIFPFWNISYIPVFALIIFNILTQNPKNLLKISDLKKNISKLLIVKFL